MIAHVNNAFAYLIGTLLDAAVYIMVLRVLLHMVHADFFNPVSQMVWKITQPAVRPLQTLLPRNRLVDLASAVVLLALALLDIEIMTWMYGYSIGILAALWYAALKILLSVINLYTLSLLVYALLSWFGPGSANPAANILWSLNEPLLRPLRKMLPPIAGLDWTPMLLMVLLQFLARLLPVPGFY